MLRPDLLSVGNLLDTPSGGVGATSRNPMLRDEILSIRKSPSSPGRKIFVLKPTNAPIRLTSEEKVGVRAAVTSVTIPSRRRSALTYSFGSKEGDQQVEQLSLRHAELSFP